jgi:phosphoadenosine phosphosulfate reductase
VRRVSVAPPPLVEVDLARENARLELATPEERLAFAADTFGEGLLFTSSFGAQSGVLLHLWSVVCRHLPVTFIDTGFLFPETLAYRDALVASLGLRVNVVRPDLARDAFLAAHGEDIQKRDSDLCCAANKVAPIAPLKEHARAWVSGLRRDQSRARANVSVLERDGHLVRVHPIADLTAADVSAYLTRHAVREHPLVARRYLSIGCVPCTRAVEDGEDERAGRWAGSAKTECGLHDRPARRAPGG